MPTTLFASESYFFGYIQGKEDSLDKYILQLVEKELKKTLNIKFHYRGTTFARSLLLMQQGANDFMALLKKQPERDTYLYYIEPPMFNLNVTFIVRKGEHALIQSYEDLYGLRIAGFRGANFFRRFTIDKQLNKSYIISLQQGIGKLLLNRLDAVIASEHVTAYELHRLGLENQVEISDYIFREPNPLYFAVSKKSSIMQQLHLIEPIIRNMLESGELYSAIRQFYTQRGLQAPHLQ